MRPTFLGFEASKTAIFLNQKALDITGHNLSNVSTEGYTRQRVVQTSNYTDNTKSRYAAIKGINDGEGVNMKGVNQVRNERLDVSYRTQNKEVGYFEQKNNMLSNVENILQEFDEGKNGNGYAISNSLYEIYTALEDFSNNPVSEADANVVATSFDSMAQTLNSLYRNLDEYSKQCKDELQIKVDNLNTTFSKIAQLNDSIKTSVIANGYTDEFGPNELMDERNMLLDEISAYGDTSIVKNIDGTVDVTFNGHKVIEGNVSDSIHMQEDKSKGTVSLTWFSDGDSADTGIGSLKAYTDIINGAGVNASDGQSAENGVIYYKNKLDNFAAKMADVFNNMIPASKDADGNVTSYVKIFGAYDSNGNINPEIPCSASDISITKELQQDSSILIEDKNVADNTNILRMITALTEDEYSFDEGTFTGTFSDFVNDYVGTLGSDVNYTGNRAAAVSNIADEILNSRDSVSGVSESEETVNMLTYNRAYQAAARMMTVMDDLLDVLINQMAV